MGAEEFVFDEVPEILREYAYKDICFSLPKSGTYECSGHQLAYDKYVGKRGYYTPTKFPVRMGDYVLRHVILETGEMVYLVSSPKYSHVGDTRMPYEEYKKRKEFVPYPIVEGASVLVTGYSEYFKNKDRFNVSSTKDNFLSIEEINAIQHIAKQHPKNGVRIADLMTMLSVDYDDFEGRTTISSFPFNNEKSYLSLRIIIKDDGTIIPFVTTYYKAENWLFVSDYSVKADDYKYRSDSLKFERDNSAGTIWEWNNTLVDDKSLGMLKKVANAKSATIRFNGQQYYNDHDFTAAQQKDLRNLIELVELLK